MYIYTYIHIYIYTPTYTNTLVYIYTDASKHACLGSQHLYMCMHAMQLSMLRGCTCLDARP